MAPDRPTPTGRAMRALADILLHPQGYSQWHGELATHDVRSRETVRDLLALVDPATARVSDWTNAAGSPHRSYRGKLPCGLTLVIVTDATVVPPVELPEAARSGE